MSLWEVRLSLCICFYPCRSVRPLSYHCALSFYCWHLCNANWAGPHLLGPRNLPALSHQMDQWLSNVWETAFLRKTLVNNLFSIFALLLIFSVIFPWTVREDYFVFRHVSFNIQWTFTLPLLPFELFNLYLFVLLLFEQSSLIYCICYFHFCSCSLLQNLFLLLRFLTLFNPTVARAYSLDFCRSYYRIMFSVLKYLDISCCWM